MPLIIALPGCVTLVGITGVADPFRAVNVELIQYPQRGRSARDFDYNVSHLNGFDRFNSYYESSLYLKDCVTILGSPIIL